LIKKEQDMQGQFGLNKKNPVITIQTTEDGKKLLIYIGFLYYTSIPNDKKSVQYRLFVGQLALAGFSIASLMRVFGFSRPTIMHYCDVVGTTTDETELFAILRGYHYEKTKLSPDVEAYTKARFATVYRDNRASYNSQLRDEVCQKFGVKLSAEALRQVIAPLRQQFDGKQQAEQEILYEVSEPQSECDSVLVAPADSEVEQLTLDSLYGEVNINDDGVVDGSALIEIPSAQSTASRSELTTESTVPEDTNNGELHIHAGLLVLNLWLADFAAGFKNWLAPFLQWLYQIFTGAVNLEKTRYLSYNEFTRFIGQPAARVSQSRLILRELAHKLFGKCLQMLFEVNLEFIIKHLKNKCCYFYIDGHFDPYYGITEILKGWCCILNRAMKGTNHYTIHDTQGYLIAKELKDCFEDFRAYLKQAIQKIKSFMPGLPVGIVFDRGGFAEDMFVHFDAEGVYFFSWEKYFDIKKESGLKFDSTVTIEREINKVGHFKSIVFNCAETSYRLGETFSCRKLVIYTEKIEKNREKSDFYASILTNDPHVNHQMIVELMTGRWSYQENDYKYQKKYFGLDQITSYDVTPVQSIKPLIDQKKGFFEALKQEHADGRAKIDQLYGQLGVKRLTKKRAQLIEQEADNNPQRFEAMLQLRAFQPTVQQLQAQLVQQEKKIKRLQKIENKGYVKLDYRKKQIFDHVRFAARNVFYNAIAEFRQHYCNLRDLHVVFWKLVRSPGYIQYEKEQINVTLYCPIFKGRVLEAVESFLEKLNENKPVLLDGSNRKIVFYLKS
jgi:hypothetical protein